MDKIEDFAHRQQAVDPNITAFAGPEHSGKLLHYVGWADQLISPGNPIHYYESVYEFFQANTNIELDDFYRLFFVPGMWHWWVHSSLIQSGTHTHFHGSSFSHVSD